MRDLRLFKAAMPSNLNVFTSIGDSKHVSDRLIGLLRFVLHSSLAVSAVVKLKDGTKMLYSYKKNLPEVVKEADCRYKVSVETL